MPVETLKSVVAKFPLRLMPSIRRSAQAFSQKEGVSLNQFINVAVAEKLAHLEHHEWLLSRKKPTKESLDRALTLLDQGANNAPEPGDELPEGYRPARARPQASPRRRRT